MFLIHSLRFQDNDAPIAPIPPKPPTVGDVLSESEVQALLMFNAAPSSRFPSCSSWDKPRMAFAIR